MELNLEKNLPLLKAHNCALWFVIVQEDGASDAVLFAKLLATVEALVKSYPTLAAAKDANNRAALDVASKPMRKVIESVIFFCGHYDIHHGPPVHMSSWSLLTSMNTEYETVYDDVVKTPGEKMDVKAFGEALDKLSLQGFGGAAELLAVVKGVENGLEGYFKHCDENNDKFVNKEEFVKYCGNIMGRSRRVAIKFMKNEDQYQHEKDMRKDLKPQYVVGLLPSPNEDDFKEAVKTFCIQKVFSVQKVDRDTSLPLKDFKHCIVMPAADRTLDAIFRSERPDIIHVRAIMEEIAHALKHLHDNKIIHGDLKMLNILRVDGHIRLIDLDAACSLGDPAGCKFSSGVLPPEMFAYLTTSEQSEQFETYWKRTFTMKPELTSTDEVKLGQAESELWEKIKPRIAADGKLIVVKTFAMDDNKLINKPIVAGLPYDLVEASVAIDVWAFGVLLYCLVSASPLLVVNRDEDLLDKDYASILEWADKKGGILQEMIDTQIRPKDSSAADLLIHLLNPDPEPRRLYNMDVLLADKFFESSKQGDGVSLQLMRSIDHNLSKVVKDVIEIKDDMKEVKKDVKTALVKLNSISEQIGDLKEFQRMGFEALQQQAMRYHEEDKEYFKAQAAMLDAQFELLQKVDGKIDGLSEQMAKGFLKMESTFDRVGAKLVTEIMANGESQLKNFEEFQRQLNGLQADSKDLPAQIKMMVESSMSSMTEDITAKLRESMVEVTHLPSYL